MRDSLGENDLKAPFGFVICISFLASGLALGGCAMPGATPASGATSASGGGLAVQYADVQRVLDAKCRDSGIDISVHQNTHSPSSDGVRNEVVSVAIAPMTRKKTRTGIAEKRDK